MLDIFCSHVLITFWILFAQTRLHIITPTAGIFLMNVNLFCLAERSWRIQAKTMLIWHPVIQLFFCVSRMVHGAAAITSLALWGRVFMLCL
jgi:hypothetical protein